MKPVKGGSAIILAGGKSSRMGRDKALIEIFGELLVARVARVISPLFESLIVVANGDLEAVLPDAAIVKDIFPGKGPLGGIHAGLTASRSEENFVVACDMPFVSPAVIQRIRALRDKADVCLPETEKGLEPLCAVYSKSCLPQIERALRSNRRRVTAFFSEVDVRIVKREELEGLDGVDLAFLNVNTREDLEAALQMGAGVYAGEGASE